MKTFLKILSIFGLVFINMSASNATSSSFSGVYINGLNIDSGGNNILYIKVNQAAGVGGCHTDPNWNFAISLDPTSNPTGKYMFMQMLAAKTADSPVDIVGLATCPATGTIQGIQRISY